MSPKNSEFHVGNIATELPHIEGLKRRGLMLAVSAPSGTGKTTMCQLLLQQDDNIQLSISATTRHPPRPNEVHGVDYYFVTSDEFKRMLADGELLEHTKVHGNYYGTPRGPVEDILAKGIDILFEIDAVGVNQIAAFSRADLVSVFVLPPSAAEMEARMRNRTKEEESFIQHRLVDNLDQFQHSHNYDYVIINKDIEDSMFKLRTILGAERMKRHRLRGLDNFTKIMRDETESLIAPDVLAERNNKH
ncbi:MAG TPA: guanylate kinase [Alphaproteobacteria bacterium]